MVDVKNRRCEHPGCTSRPVFNREGESRGRFCAVHREPGMVDVKTRRCDHPGCTSRPVFNKEGESRGRFCAVHRETGMVDVKNRRCDHPGCSLHPVFNKEGESRGRFCSLHKEPDMVDMQHRRCVECSTRASYGLPGHPASYCAAHKRAGTMRHSRRICSEKRCRDVATHGITRPERCETHTLPGDDNLVEQECTSCCLPNIVNADGLCVYCNEHLTGKRPRLARQREVLQFLDCACADIPYDTTDVVPQDLRACDRRERPDVMWDQGDRVVILEVDEDQHRSRPCECEQTRMINVSEALRAPHTLWIRYNPDAFQSPEARAWGSRAKRHSLLQRWLRWALEAPLEHTIGAMYLFFDGFREGDVCVQKLL